MTTFNRQSVDNTYDPFADLFSLQEQLENRIEERKKILQIIAEGNVKEGLQKASTAGIDIFDDDLSLSVLQGKLKAVDQFVEKAGEYEKAIERVNALVGTERLSKFDHLEGRVNTVKVQGMLLEADTALLELDFVSLSNLLAQATPIAEELNDDVLIGWVGQLKADFDFLHSLPTSVPVIQSVEMPLSFLDVQRWKEHLIDKQTALEHSSYQKLKKALSQDTNSRLLKKYKSLHFAFVGKSATTTPATASDSPPVMEKNIYGFDTFLQAYCRSDATEEEIKKKFEEVQHEVEEAWGIRRNLGEMLTTSFFLAWSSWIEQSNQIGEVLTEMEKLLSHHNSPSENSKAMSNLVSRLNGLLVNSESIAVYRWHQQYGPQFDKLITFYSRSNKPAEYISAMNETAFMKSKQGYESLIKLKSSPTYAPRLPTKHQLDRGK